MPQPVVRAFGPLRLEVDGDGLGPTDLGGRKPKLILEILLLADGRPVSRDRLADLLWDEDRPRNVPGTIDTYVSVLRRTLGRHRDLLVTEREAYRLARSELLVDLDRFDLLAERAATRPNGRERRATLEDALSLAHGEVLEDEPYADWLHETREHYRRRVLDLRVEAGLAALVAGDGTAAVAHAEQVLDGDRLEERAHRLAMLGHHLGGVRSGALRAYERCREVLAEELGADPSQETEDLHVAILRGRAAAELVAAHDEGAERPSARTSRAAARRGRSLHVLLVEDTPSDARLIREALESGTVPMHVHHVPDGETALDYVREAGTRPDLVLLDLHLPGRSGLEVLAELKQDPSLRRLPVVMLTSSAAQQDVASSYDLHANSYVTKPTDPDDFGDVVRALEAFWPLTASAADPGS